MAKAESENKEAAGVLAECTETLSAGLGWGASKG